MDWRELITQSHRDLVGPGWLEPHEIDGAKAVVLCHDSSTDPCFVYANAAAALLWERPVADFLGWPSRYTAPPSERLARAVALSRLDVVRDYSGIRVTRSGRLFRIEQAIVWPVLDSGTLVGQAATFTDWQYLD